MNRKLGGGQNSLTTPVDTDWGRIDTPAGRGIKAVFTLKIEFIEKIAFFD